MTKTFTQFAVVILATMFSILPAFATSTGITLRSLSTSGGCGPSGCHAPTASTLTQLTIVEAVNNELTMEAGSTITLTLRVAHTQRPAAGVNISVKTKLQGSTDAGTLEKILGAGLHLQGPELTHDTPKLLSGGFVEFAFKWKAPAQIGSYFLHAVANAVNLNGNRDQNDIWNWLTPVTINVTPVSSVSEGTFQTSHVKVYPVPAHDLATVSAQAIPGETLLVQVIDATGLVVRQETRRSDSENFVFVWDGRTNSGASAAQGNYTVAVIASQKITSGTIVWIAP